MRAGGTTPDFKGLGSEDPTYINAEKVKRVSETPFDSAQDRPALRKARLSRRELIPNESATSLGQAASK